MLVRVVIGDELVNVVSAYAPQVGLPEEEKNMFWDTLDDLVRGIPEEQRVYLGGDFNGHIGADAEGYRGVHGGFAYGVRNEEGRRLLEFASAHDLVVTNSFFKKKDEHLITYYSGSHKTQIDYILVRRGQARACKDCKVFPGEACSSQHRLVVLDLSLRTGCKQRAKPLNKRILWKNLNGTEAVAFREKMEAELVNRSFSDADSAWNSMASKIRDTARATLGMTSGKPWAPRESWWFSEEVRAKVREKQDCFKELIRSREGEEDEFNRVKDRYKVARKEAKRVVAKAKEKAYNELYSRLDSKEGQNDIFKLAKSRERRRQDLGTVTFIKDESGRTLVKEEEIRCRWREFFCDLFNPPQSGGPVCERESEEGALRRHNNCFPERIGQEEVERALRRMGKGKAVGPDLIPVEAWKCLGELGIRWLTYLFNLILQNAKMPEEWRLSVVTPIYKNKGDAQDCRNYRGIKLLSHTMKLWERVIEHRLRCETRVSDNQFGFMPGRSTTEAIHLIRSLMERYRERQRDLHVAFLDLEKAYDSVPRDSIWKTLDDRLIPMRYIEIVRDMYDRSRTCVRTPLGDTDFFPVDRGLHQGSALSPFLFAVILDELTRHIQGEIPWCMIFADDIVLASDSKAELNSQLELWRRALEDNGLKISREKTEYMLCDFSKNESAEVEEIHIGGKVLQPKESFRYLGSMLHKSGRIDEDVSNRIKTGWQKWRAATGFLCDKRIPWKLKGKFYRMAIRPAMLYGSECWPLKKAQAEKVEVAELRMLRWICGKKLIDKIPVGVFRSVLGVARITEKLREGRLRWFGHVRRRQPSEPVRRAELIIVNGTRRRGRPTLRWEERVRRDMEELRITEDMISDRVEWRRRIRVDD